MVSALALRQGRALVDDASAACVQTCFALLAAVGDTNLLYRGGLAGARYAGDAASAPFALAGSARLTGASAQRA
jgi:triphosphoribosyl-dephospho-CoA synthase